MAKGDDARARRTEPDRGKPRRSRLRETPDPGGDDIKEHLQESVLLAYELAKLQVGAGRRAAKGVYDGNYSWDDAEGSVRTLTKQSIRLAKEMAVAWFSVIGAGISDGDQDEPKENKVPVNVICHSDRDVGVRVEAVEIQGSLPQDFKVVPVPGDERLSKCMTVQFSEDRILEVTVDIPADFPHGQYGARAEDGDGRRVATIIVTVPDNRP